MDAPGLVQRLLLDVPEVEDVVREHLHDNDDDLLLHLLLPDLLREAVRLFHADEHEVERRLLGVVELALREGDGYVENAVLVSFVEGAGTFREESPEFLATWPPGLAAARALF